MPDGDLKIEGVVYDSNDLTFREEREVRKLVRELVADATVDFESLPLGDILPIMCFVLHRRDDPEYTLDQAMELKQRDVFVSDGEEEVRPTRRGGTSKKSTSAGSGPQK